LNFTSAGLSSEVEVAAGGRGAWERRGDIGRHGREGGEGTEDQSRQRRRTVDLGPSMSQDTHIQSGWFGVVLSKTRHISSSVFSKQQSNEKQDDASPWRLPGASPRVAVVLWSSPSRTRTCANTHIVRLMTAPSVPKLEYRLSTSHSAGHCDDCITG
jgi:hypothetical protein